MPFSPVDVLVRLADVLGRLGVGWYVFGAQAAAVHGAARLTIDVDVTVALGEKTTEMLANALTRAGFRLRFSDDELVRRTRVLPVVDDASHIPVDVVLAGPGIEDLFLERAEIHRIGGVSVPVACAEDIVVMKILAGRGKDQDDVVAVLRAKAQGFRFELAKETLALLEQALDRSDLTPALADAAKRAGVTAGRSEANKTTTAKGGPRKRSRKS